MNQLQLFTDNDYTQHKKYVNGILKSKEELIELAKQEGRKKIFRALSFGAGTQSAHLLEAHFRNEVHYDYIVFSDTRRRTPVYT